MKKTILFILFAIEIIACSNNLYARVKRSNSKTITPNDTLYEIVDLNKYLKILAPNDSLTDWNSTETDSLGDSILHAYHISYKENLGWVRRKNDTLSYQERQFIDKFKSEDISMTCRIKKTVFEKDSYKKHTWEPTENSDDFYKIFKDHDESTNEDVYCPESYPVFKDGEYEMMNLIYKNLRYPVKAQENGIQGRVILKLLITERGSISEVEIVRSLDPECDKEAIRVIKLLPNFIPGRKNCKNTSFWYTVPVTFKLE